MTASPHPTVLKYGLISGLVGVLLFAISAISGMSNLSSMLISALVGFLTLFASIAFPVMGVRYHRNIELGGYISFAQAFAVCFGIIMLGMIISNIGQYFYTSFIDPYYYENMAEQMQEMFEKFNVPESDMDQALEQIKNGSSSSGLLKNILSGGVLAAILATIIAAIMQKRPGNPFNDHQSSGEL